MKKTKNIFLYLFLLLVAFVLAVALIWNFSPVKGEIQARIVKKLRPHLGDSFFLKDFSLGFGYISFNNVKTSNPQKTYLLDLDEIRIDYNWMQLITERFNPVKIIDSITLNNPRLILYSMSDSLLPAVQQDSLSMDEIAENVLVNIQKFPGVDRLSVKNGEIYWRGQQGNSISIFKNLDGYFANRPEGAVFDLQGRLLGFEESAISLKGNINFPEEHWQARLTLNDCRITSNLPFIANGFYQLEFARLNGYIDLENPSFIMDSLTFAGDVEVEDFSAYFFNQYTTAPHIHLKFMDQKIIINPFTGHLEEGQARFSGELIDIFNPRVDWHLNVEKYPAHLLKKSHDIFEYVLEGEIKGEFRFQGPLRSMEITGEAQSPAVLYAIVPFTNVRTKLIYKDKVLRFPYLRGDFKKFRTQGNGTVNFRTDQLSFNMDSDLPIPPGTFKFLDRLNETTIWVKTLFQGDFSQKQFGGTFDYFFRKNESDYVYGGGPFRLNDQYLTFKLASEDLADTMKTTGVVDKLFSDPNFKILDFKNIPVRQLTTNPIIENLANDYLVNAYFAGPYNFLNGKINTISRISSHNIFTVTANIKDVFNDNQFFKGRFAARTEPLNLEGDYEVSYGEKGILAKLFSPGLFRGDLFVAYESDGPFSGKLNINRFSISDYLASSPMSQSILQGFFRGEVLFSGTVRHPDVRFNLAADEFIINDVGYYSTQVNGRLQNNTFNFDSCEVRLNEVPVFDAGLSWNILTDSLNLSIIGKQIESNFLAETIFEDKTIIRGNFSYSIFAEGLLKRPLIYGDIQVRDGIFETYPFDLISITFEDSLLPGAKFYELESHIIKIRKFIYVNQKEYTIEGDGLLAVDSNGPLDIRFNVVGNILAELPKIESYFRNPSSNGRLYAHISGTRASPLFEEMHLQIFTGHLEFESVLPPLQNLQMEVELLRNENFVHIKNVSGTLENRWAKIYNISTADAGVKNLEPLLFEDIGLNFGILVLETDPRGIPLAIPGLMQEEDIGYFAVDGKRKEEKFYFSGPPEIPEVRGKVVLNNSRVTFPFIGMEEESEESNLVVDFLMNINWDVLAMAGSGTRYFVDIPAYVGKVYMDLNIDNTSRGLNFTGRLIDESFRVEGSAESSRGRVEYLDMNFRVEKFGAEFNRFDLFPEVYGRAYTTVRDSAGNFPRDIYLVLYAIDPETKEEISKGRWEDFRFKLVSGDPTIGETQEQVLSYLGYSVQNLQKKAGTVGLTMTENFLFRPLVRPLERRLERGLGLDYVRLRSNFTQNLFYYGFINRNTLNEDQLYLSYGLNNNLDPALILLQSSEVTLGKYILRNMYLTYTGQLVSVYEEAKLGLNHRFGLEYRLLRNLLFEIEYDQFQFNPIYYDRQALNDFRIRFRHSIIFDLHDLF